jgi:hypothetical protein
MKFLLAVEDSSMLAHNLSHPITTWKGKIDHVPYGPAVENVRRQTRSFWLSYPGERRPSFARSAPSIRNHGVPREAEPSTTRMSRLNGPCQECGRSA